MYHNEIDFGNGLNLSIKEYLTMNAQNKILSEITDLK